MHGSFILALINITAEDLVFAFCIDRLRKFWPVIRDQPSHGHIQEPHYSFHLLKKELVMWGSLFFPYVAKPLIILPSKLS